MSEQRQFSSFFVHDLHLGIAVHEVQEVIRHLEMTRVPLAPPLVSGLINLRGQIITAIDLRHCLDLPERPPDQVPVHLILRTDDGPLSLLVDDVGAVLEPDDDAFEFPLAALKGRLRALVCQVYKLPSRLLLVLDTQRLLAEFSAVSASPGCADENLGDDRMVPGIRVSGIGADANASLRLSAEPGGSK